MDRRCFPCFGKQEEIWLELSSGGKDSGSGLKLEQVELAYGTLQLFIDGMVSTFPSLAGKLAPFVRAAKSLNQQ